MQSRLLRWFRQKLPIKAISAWICLVLVVSLLGVRRPRFLSPDGSELLHLPNLGEGTKLIDAVAFISVGDMARDPLLDYAVATVRKVGGWKGDIYVLTDKPDCLKRVASEYGVKIVTIPKKGSLMQIKALKPQLLSLIPATVDSVMYLDVDIAVTRSLGYFMRMVGRDLLSASVVGDGVHNISSASAVARHSKLSNFDFAAFGDAKGHYVGFCAGCEKWHTGVMILRRGKGTKCLDTWGELLASGRFHTDQESLDRAERMGVCKGAHMLPSQYLLFAKDYLGALFTTGHTFVHVTSAGRMATQDAFYRGWVVPRFRAALSDRVDPKLLDSPKQC